MSKIRCAHKILDKALEIHNKKRNNKMSYSLTLSEIKQILKKYKLLITTNIKKMMTIQLLRSLLMIQEM